MDHPGVGQALNPMTGVLVREAGGDQQTAEEQGDHGTGGTFWGGGGRDWGNTSTSQGTPRSARSHQKLRKGPRTGSPSEPPGANPMTLTSDFWPPDSERIRVCV